MHYANECLNGRIQKHLLLFMLQPQMAMAKLLILNAGKDDRKRGRSYNEFDYKSRRNRSLNITIKCI